MSINNSNRINQITIGGNLTADAQLRYTSNATPIVSFRVAVFDRYDADGQPKSDFFNVSVWGNKDVQDKAAFLCEKLQKGMQITVQGEMHSREYLDRSGNKQTAWEVTGYQLFFDRNRQNAEAAEAEPLAEDPAKDVTDAFQELYEDDGELPFK